MPTWRPSDSRMPSLHAAVRVDAGDTSRLEHLCRYVIRPALSNKRLAISSAGKAVHELRAPFRDGTTHFVFEPLVFIERLAALVPPPRMHQLTYHGVLAPAANWRGDIVPGPAERDAPCADGAGGACDLVPNTPGPNFLPGCSDSML